MRFTKIGDLVLLVLLFFTVVALVNPQGAMRELSQIASDLSWLLHQVVDFLAYVVSTILKFLRGR